MVSTKSKKEVKFFEEPIEFGRPIVTKGRMFSFPLKSCIRKSDINKGNCVSIVWDSESYIFYGLVIGEEANIFMFDSNSTIEDVGKIDIKNPKNGVLTFDCKNNLFCIIDDGEKIKIFKHDVSTERRMYSHMWGHFTYGPIEDINVDIKSDNIYSAVKNDFDGLIYFLTKNGSIYNLNTDSGKINKIVDIESNNLSASICSIPENGEIFGVHKEGKFYKIANGNVNYLKSQIPCMKNRNYIAQVGKLVYFNKKIYGGTLQDGYLFTYDIENDLIKNIGRADENHQIRDIDVLKDGRIFGITACKEGGTGRIFSYSEKRGFEDIGIIQAWQPVHDFAYQPLCITAGNSGDFLIGNGEERRSIFLYCSAPL